MAHVTKNETTQHVITQNRERITNTIQIHNKNLRTRIITNILCPIPKRKYFH
jgi:hypothetical protein